MRHRSPRNSGVIFGVIFMKFSPKCNTKSDIGKFVIKVWEFLTLFGKKQGPLPALNLP